MSVATLDGAPPPFDPGSRIWSVVRHGLCVAIGATLVVAGWLTATFPLLAFVALTGSETTSAGDEEFYNDYSTAAGVVFLAALSSPLLGLVAVWLERRAMRAGVFWVVAAVVVPVVALGAAAIGVVVVAYAVTVSRIFRIAVGVIVVLALVFAIYWLLLWLVNVVSYGTRRVAYSLRRRGRLMSDELGEARLALIYRSRRWTVARHAIVVGAMGVLPGGAVFTIFTPAILLGLLGIGAGEPESTSHLRGIAGDVTIVTLGGLAAGALVAVPAWALERLVRRGRTPRSRSILAVTVPIAFSMVALALLIGGSFVTAHPADTFAAGVVVLLLLSGSFAAYWSLLWLAHVCHLGVRYRRLRRRWRKLRRVQRTVDPQTSPAG